MAGWNAHAQIVWLAPKSPLRPALLRVDPAAVVVDLDALSAPDVSAVIRLARSTCPGLAVVVYCRPSIQSAAAIATVGRLGIDALVFQDRMDVSAELRRVLSDRIRPATGYGMLRGIARSLHPVAAEVANLIISDPRAFQSVAHVATALRCTPRTVERRFAHGMLPRPAKLLRLMRWFIASHVAADSERPSERLVERLGFPSRGSFSKALRRALQIGASELRSPHVRLRLQYELLELYGVASRNGEPASETVHQASHLDSLLVGVPMVEWAFPAAPGDWREPTYQSEVET
jgi:AraC-like DNA-binding protein